MFNPFHTRRLGGIRGWRSTKPEDSSTRNTSHWWEVISLVLIFISKFLVLYIGFKAPFTWGRLCFCSAGDLDADPALSKAGGWPVHVRSESWHWQPALLCGWLGVNGPAVNLHPTAPPIHFAQTEGNIFPFVFSFWSGWSLAGVNWYKSVNLWTSIEVDGGSNWVCLKRGEPDQTNRVKGAQLFSQAAKEELELEVQLSFTSEKIYN